MGDPILFDESLERFDSEVVDPGDIVGIGISPGNCLAGYRVLREAKLKGAPVRVFTPPFFPENRWRWEPMQSLPATAILSGAGPYERHWKASYKSGMLAAG